MKAVLKHEFSSLFCGVIGYVFGAFLLVFCGIFVKSVNLDYGNTSFEGAIYNMDLIFVFAIPVITMRVLAEERHSKTDQLLYTLPISMTQVVLGKYFALLMTLLIPTVIMGLYPCLLSAYGDLNLLTSFNALLGFFLLGAALLSIGMFISSITESQGVAAGVCFVVMLLNYFLKLLASYVTSVPVASYVAFALLLLVPVGIFWYMTKNKFVSLIACTVSQTGLLAWYLIDSKAFSNAFPDMINKLSLFEQFRVFTSGICDVTCIVYFISVIVFFVYLTVQSMEKRRWSE